uniref:SurA N-terminal domain-containing protein n=1 Tax=Candidatus Kentrum sp. LFY TaxID=2126342 RepID=A0A450UZM2_9GAMM|nr:MAG: hypothetical protein BECKLFY1418A_GA0070994_10773 [Candidatus Kentron sp. LFY]
MKMSNKRSCFAGVTLLLALFSAQTLAADRVVFELNGVEYRESELSPEARLSLFELESKHYRELQPIFDKVLADIYFEKEAGRLEKTEEEVRAEHLPAVEPDEKDIRALYESRKDLIGKPYEAVRHHIVRALRKKQVREKKAELGVAYREKSAFRVLLPPPVPPLLRHRHHGGPGKGQSRCRSDHHGVCRIPMFALQDCWRIPGSGRRALRG